MAYTLIQRQVASNVSSVDFTNITTDYNEYLLTYTHYKPVTDEKHLEFQGEVGAGTTYGQDITSNNFTAGQNLADTWYLLENGGNSYGLGADVGGHTDPDFQRISYGGEANTTYPHMALSGYLRLYDPSNGSHVKHFESVSNSTYTGNGATNQTYCIHWAAHGTFDTTTAITRVRFQPRDASGNIFTGIFTLYGVG